MVDDVKLAPRTRKASNAVKKGALVGGPATTLITYGAMWLHDKYGIPLEVSAAAVGLLSTFVAGFAQWKAKGGRVGESH